MELTNISVHIQHQSHTALSPHQSKVYGLLGLVGAVKDIIETQIFLKYEICH